MIRKNIRLIIFAMIAFASFNNYVGAKELNMIDESYELSKEYAIENNTILFQSNSYVETSIHYKNGEVLEVKEKNITKEEYESSGVQSRTVCYDITGADDCWETASKKVVIAAWSVGTAPCKSYRIQIDNLWKSVPNVKSFDVIAIKHDEIFGVSGAVGYQYYKIDGEDYTIQYSPNGTNTKILDNGIGTSMNIVDDVTSDLHLKLLVEGGMSEYGIVSFFGTYQHATSAVTLAQSQSYNFNHSSTALGGVLNFTSSSIRSRYDGMQGVSGSFVGDVCYI